MAHYHASMRAAYFVVSAEVVADHRLRLTFADGFVGEVDLGAELWGPVFEPLRDPAYFRLVSVDPEGGTIVWPNGADLAPETLYASARGGQISSAAAS